MNPWHSVEVGDKSPEIVRAVIEIPQGSKAKYELDKTTGLLKLDRVLFSSVHYPANYGFIPQSYFGDGDPLDILVLSQISLVPMCIVEARIIGVMRMIDQGEPDDKIISVAANDASVRHYGDIKELPEHALNELRGFFEDYKKLEHKTVEVDRFLGKDEAYGIVRESLELYQKEFSAGKKR